MKSWYWWLIIIWWKICFVLCYWQEGFWYHHAEPNYLMLVYWIPKTGCTIPPNASHSVGVGAIVLNDKKEVWNNQPCFMLALYSFFFVWYLCFGVVGACGPRKKRWIPWHWCLENTYWSGWCSMHSFKEKFHLFFKIMYYFVSKIEIWIGTCRVRRFLKQLLEKWKKRQE